MDIMDNYPECTTQPHSCLQLRPKQLPPPLHPSSSPHDNVLQPFRGVGIFLTLTKSRDGQSYTTSRLRKPRLQAVCPEAQCTHRTESVPEHQRIEHSEFRECWGISRWSGRKYFLKKQSCPVSRGRLKATTGLWCDLATWHLWAFWINISFSIKYESRGPLPSVHHCLYHW